ncbi:iron complex transport system substrate-binding protein [Melghirimyces profundicolus]|uniref:Iron complex transport system substrate-binding protein n=1 Tax=Melghirimyces profundicolus TaxID=1242148 RepID=A0A2T6B608_9BACL|nr:ABC transporter substrate-binding protein [Melghirimyces profundicolus]PTX51484.1 iron complex transport system substrate-binding protein [Melghirimyces profundicolus]
MRSWSRWMVLILALSMLFTVSGCTSVPGANQEADRGQEKQSAGFPVTLKDDTGKQVKVKKKPERIVSLIPSMTETVYAVGAGDRVVGVTTHDNYPEEVKKVEKVGDMKINPEKVVSLKPDLVLASTGLNGEETIEKLRKLGLTVIAYEPKDLKGVYKQIEAVGKATGNEKRASEWIKKMEQEKETAEKIASQVPEKKRAKVWVEVSPDLFTAGNHTFMNELIILAGGENVANGQEGWVQVSEEKVVKWNPDVILYTHSEKKEKIASRDGWKNIRAVKEDRIEHLNTDIVSRPGPRITKGLLHITKAIYPKEYARTVQ